LILTVPGKEALDGKALWLEYDPSDSSWQCSSEIDDKLLPAKCRG
jgi:type IV pilus assembly protein PilA